MSNVRRQKAIYICVVVEAFTRWIFVHWLCRRQLCWAKQAFMLFLAALTLKKKKQRASKQCRFTKKKKLLAYFSSFTKCFQPVCQAARAHRIHFAKKKIKANKIFLLSEQNMQHTFHFSFSSASQQKISLSKGVPKMCLNILEYFLC